MLPEEIKLKLEFWLKENWMVALIILGCTIVALGSLIWFPKDNRIEELAEKEIEVLTGIPVDFTP